MGYGKHYKEQQKKEKKRNNTISYGLILFLPLLIFVFGLINGLIAWFGISAIGMIFLWFLMTSESKEMKRAKAKDSKEFREEYEENELKKKKQNNFVKKKIVSLLRSKSGEKIPASAIDRFLEKKSQSTGDANKDWYKKMTNIFVNDDAQHIKELCEELYIDGEIQRTGNYRYFV